MTGLGRAGLGWAGLSSTMEWAELDRLDWAGLGWLGMRLGCGPRWVEMGRADLGCTGLGSAGLSRTDLGLARLSKTRLG